MFKKHIRFLTFIPILSLLCITACESPAEGCLDIEAQNYNVTADKACDSCCTYPDLIITLDHVVDSLNFSLNQRLAINGDSLLFQRLKYYISDVQLYQSGSWIGVEDNLSIVAISGNDSAQTTVEDNFAIILAGQQTYTLGTRRQYGQFDSVRFTLGVPHPANAATPDQFDAQHPLAVQPDTMYLSTDESYIFWKIEVQTDTSGSSLREIIGTTPDSVTLSFPFSYSFNAGFDIQIPFTVDYQEWFSGIDFVNDTDAEIRQKVKTNAEEAFTIQ